MLSNQVLYKTKVDEEEFMFICRAGCETKKAFQAADEVRTFLYGLWKQQEEQAASQKPLEPQGDDGNK